MPARLPANKLLLLGLVMLTCLLAACTKTKLAYGLLDNWLRWTIDDYFDATPAQKEQIKTLSKSFHHWHRQNELMPLAQFTEQAAQLLAQPTISPDQVAQQADQLRRAFQRSAKQLQHLSNDILTSLSPVQIKQISQQLVVDQRQYQEEYLAVSRQQRIDDRARATADFFARPLGKLNDQQRRLIADWSASVDNLAAESLLQQLLWRQHLEQRLRADLSMEDNLSALTGLLLNPLPPLGAEHQRRELANRKRLGQLLVDLHRTLTSQQRARIQKRLARYRRDFLELAGAAALDDR